MCGRYVTVSSPTLLADRFDVTEIRPRELEPNYNVAPRADVPVIAERHGERVLDVVRWGLIPSWAKDRSIGDRLINARGEKLTTSNAFKRAFERRRCIVPADGFYEWQAIEGQRIKQPWFFRRRDGEPLAFAGLWEIWHDPEVGDDAPRIRTCTIITTARVRRCPPLARPHPARDLRGEARRSIRRTPSGRGYRDAVEQLGAVVVGFVHERRHGPLLELVRRHRREQLRQRRGVAVVDVEPRCP